MSSKPPPQPPGPSKAQSKTKIGMNKVSKAVVNAKKVMRPNVTGGPGSISRTPSRAVMDSRSVSDRQSIQSQSQNQNQNQTRVIELQNYVVNKIELMKRAQTTVKKLTQLAAFIPDYILKEDLSRKIPYQSSLDAVVLMVDVSGFTALTEAYSLKGKGGTDQLTKTLMNYIGPLAECILLADGDIVKYAGDAFLAFWTTNQDDYNEDVQKVIDCALYIQEKYGSYLCKEVDITIRVKVGIGAGIVHLCWIGNENYQHYVLFGPGVEASSNGEKNCVSGEVVLHPSAWGYCNPANYKATSKEGGYKVPTQIINYLNPDKRGRPHKKALERKGSIAGMDRRQSLGSGLDELIRPAIPLCIETKPEDFMRRFIITPVLRKMDDEIPLEYLNESRMICISFIRIDSLGVPANHEGVAFRDTMCQIVNKAFVKIYTLVTKMQGALTKVIMFDKGLTYLVVFGLPGYITENQCAHALKFSHIVRRALLGIKFVEQVSIGVTTGACWCGVLGHPRRQEYTVMGRKVNKAARLMCFYPGRVSCDQDTAYHSKLSSANFELQEFKELKGIVNPGKIYEFVNAETVDELTVATFPYPMVGREPELRFFKEVLLKSQREFNEYVKLVNLNRTNSSLGKEAVVAKGIWMIVFEGENGIGKSRMLAACMREADRQNVRVFSVAMNLMLSGQALFGLSALVLDAVGISDCRTIQEREDIIRKRVHEPDLAAELCVLNDILHTKFPLNPKYAALDVVASQVYGQHVLSTFLRVLYPDEMIMFAVDDAHLLDGMSWEHLINLSKSPNIFVLATLRRNAAGSPKIPDSVTSLLYHSKNIKVVRLNGLDTSHCTTLACQMMEVSAIPQDLEKILVQKSQGVPAWCDQVLHELLRTCVLKYGTSAKVPMVKADKTLLQKLNSSNRKTKPWAQGLQGRESTVQSSSTNLSRRDSSMGMLSRRSSAIAFSSQLVVEEIDPNTRVLLVKSGTNIGHVQIHGTLHEILLDSYDELNSNEQIILKCASVLGRKFSRQMVTRLLPSSELNSRKYESGFNHLMEARYLRCASGVNSKRQSKDQTLAPDCFCKGNDSDIDSLMDVRDPTNTTGKSLGKKSSLSKRPRYLTCKFMEFVKESLVEVVYDLMTEDQKKDFHLKAAKYLDSSVVKCESCGGGNSTHVFGIVLKTGEMGVMDNEDALRAAADVRRKSDVHGAEDMVRFNGKRRKPSWTTQIEGMKKTFVNNGSKIGQIEFEILDLLRKIDSQKRRKGCLCHKKEDFELSDHELRAQLQLLRDSEDNAYVNLPFGGDGDMKDGREVVKFRKLRNDPIDLRLCECAVLQAKVCIEMVKHYREAQKYGKCMVNLLDAAESVVTIGNGTQGLVHLEDAAALMRAIKKGDLQRPDKDDQDDVKIDEAECEGQIEYLSGLAYFEIGVQGKARDFFLKSLERLGFKLDTDENRLRKEASIIRAKSRLWRAHYLSCRCRRNQSSTYTAADEIWSKKVRILSYLHALFKQDRRLEMALLVSLWEVIAAEENGDVMHDVIPAYCNMMETHTAMSHHKDAERFEKLSLNIIRQSFGSNEQLEPVGLLTTAHLFYVIANCRLSRGAISTSADAAYLGLRIAQTIHDNSLAARLLPSLSQALLMGLKIPEVIEALQKLWYISEEEDDWCGLAMYYTLCLDLLLNTAYPMESFTACEHFVINNDWTTESYLFRDSEIQYSMESSLALWYARYGRWEQATTWLKSAESHRPKLSTFLSVAAELKLLECELIFVHHYLDCKRYQHFAKSRNAAKELMRSVSKSTKVVPALKPRFLHLMAYYYKIRSRNVEADKNLKMAEKAAVEMENHLEQEWIFHNKTVWSDMAIPTIKFFWLEHTEHHVLDWHSSGSIPWTNIMYSLPLPAWK